MKVGSGLDEKSAMGPLATAAHREKLLGYIEKGIKEGVITSYSIHYTKLYEWHRF